MSLHPTYTRARLSEQIGEPLGRAKHVMRGTSYPQDPLKRERLNIMPDVSSKYVDPYYYQQLVADNPRKSAPILTDFEKFIVKSISGEKEHPRRQTTFEAIADENASRKYYKFDNKIRKESDLNVYNRPGIKEDRPIQSLPNSDHRKVPRIFPSIPTGLKKLVDDDKPYNIKTAGYSHVSHNTHIPGQPLYLQDRSFESDRIYNNQINSDLQRTIGVNTYIKDRNAIHPKPLKEAFVSNEMRPPLTARIPKWKEERKINHYTPVGAYNPFNPAGESASYKGDSRLAVPRTIVYKNL